MNPLSDLLRNANETGRADARERCRQELLAAMDPESHLPILSWNELLVRVRSLAVRTIEAEVRLGVRHMVPSDARLNTLAISFHDGPSRLASPFDGPPIAGTMPKYTVRFLQRTTMRWALPGMTPTYEWFNWVQA